MPLRWKLQLPIVLAIVCSTVGVSRSSAQFREPKNDVSTSVRRQGESGSTTGSSKRSPSRSTRNTDPDAASKERFRDLLRQPGTGIVKLLNVDCGNAASTLLISADPLCDNIVEGGGSQFSFRRREYSITSAADIWLRNGYFITGSSLTLGAIVDIGTASIESIGPEAKGINFLTSYVPLTTLRLVQQEARTLDKGGEYAGFFYASTAEVKIGHVYGMRSIAYRSGNVSANDKRDDVLIVFSPVASDGRGNITLVWKELRRESGPLIDLSK